MWSRAVLKTKAKDAMGRNYWRCVLAALVLLIAAGAGNGFTVIRNIGEAMEDYIGYPGYMRHYGYYYHGPGAGFGMGIFWGILAVIVGMLGIVFILLAVFVFLPLEVGGCRFFLENAYEPAGAGKLLFAFRGRLYWKSVVTLFLRNLFIGLWSILFLIPGIYKAYEYRMVPYLLADCPQLSRREVFQISREMMDGQKLNAFVLDLSFIGWGILSACTLYILDIFYVGPYRRATNAELFLELKREYFAVNRQQ